MNKKCLLYAVSSHPNSADQNCSAAQGDFGDQPVRLAHTITVACTIMGIGRTTLYKLMNSGALKSVTVGRRRLVVAKSLAQLMQTGAALPREPPSS